MVSFTCSTGTGLVVFVGLDENTEAYDPVGRATLPVKDETDASVLSFCAPTIDARMQTIANASNEYEILRGMAR